MLLSEPPPTPYDLHFRIGPVPVRVHPLFWVVSLVLGISGSNPDGWRLVIWVGTVFVSILVHELGHIVAMRAYGETGHIVLHGFGGLAISDRIAAWGRGRTPGAQIVISLSGPIAGFLLSLAVAGVLLVGGGSLELTPWGMIKRIVVPDGVSRYVGEVVLYFWTIGLVWGALNLCPIYPLDGGQIARELFQLHDARRGIIQSLWLSVFTCATLALLAWTRWNLPFFGFFCIYLGVMNYMAIQELTGRGFGGGPRW